MLCMNLKIFRFSVEISLRFHKIFNLIMVYINNWVEFILGSKFSFIAFIVPPHLGHLFLISMRILQDLLILKSHSLDFQISRFQKISGRVYETVGDHLSLAHKITYDRTDSLVFHYKQSPSYL